MFIRDIIDSGKVLKLLQCGLPDSYMRLRFITLVKQEYTTYVKDFIISHMPAFTLAEVVVLMNSRARKIGDTATRRIKPPPPQQANACLL